MRTGIAQKQPVEEETASEERTKESLQPKAVLSRLDLLGSLTLGVVQLGVTPTRERRAS